MLISVIVPVYKVEKYLNRCIDSILGQTYKDFELILVDDGSPDNCGRICDEYAEKDSRIHVIHKKNGGLSDARNAGIDYAVDKGKSEWITFVDSDDWVAPNYLEVLLNLSTKYQADISLCRLLRCKEFTIATDNNYSGYVANVCDALFYQGGLACYAWAKLYRTMLISNYRFPVGMNMEDLYLIPEILLAANKIAVTENTLYYYYINENGILGNASLKTYQDAWKGYEHQIDLFAKNGEEFLRELQINSFIKNIFLAYNHVKNHPGKYHKKEIKDIKKYGKEIAKKHKECIDYKDEDIIRALGAFFVRHHIKNRLYDIMNNSNFFAVKFCRKIYYKFIFPIVKRVYVDRYEKRLKKDLNNADFSIICSNCIGGFIYHRLGMKFLSPTINCFIEPSDFIRFCDNLKYYLSLDLKFIESGKPYPVAKLDDITVFFNHSDNAKDANEMWTKRKTRVNYDNLYVILYNRYSKDETPLTKEEILMAGKIKCNNLIVLSDIPYPDIPYVLYIPKSDSDLGSLYFDSDKYGIKTYEKKFDYIGFLSKLF